MLILKNISKKLEDFNLKNISFKVNKGDYFVILGMSGAGKTVLFEIIAGLITRDTGEIFLDGKNITKEKIQNRSVGLVFQDYAVFPHMSVKDNIAYPLKSKKVKSSLIKTRVQKLAQDMSISHLLDRRPGTLSGGELQRVALARTLALNPKVLLLDEPLSSVDVKLKNELRSLLRKLNKKGQTIVHITHDYEEAISLANKIAVMQNGTIVQCGKTKDVFENPASEFVANLTGIKNFYKAKIKIDKENNRKIAVINKSLFFNLLTDYKNVSGNVLIKKNEIIISNDKITTSACNNFKGTILEIVRAHLGVEIIVDIGVKLSILITDSSLHNLTLFEGKEIWVSFKASSVKFLPN